jgi:hypothetical protein
VRVRVDVLRDTEQDRGAEPLSAGIASRCLAAVLFVAALACDSTPARERATDPAAEPSPTPARRSKLEPYPYERPAPPATPTVIDGVYSMSVSVKEAGGKAISCRRCAPYRLDPGKATLIFDRGRYYVSLVPTTTKKRCADCKDIPAFEATGHFDVSGNRLTLYNDASCTHGVGTYRWSMRTDRLVVETTNDGCFTGLRSRFLSASPWRRED